MCVRAAMCAFQCRYRSCLGSRCCVGLALYANTSTRGHAVLLQQAPVRTEILVKLPQYDAPATQTARRSNPIQEQNTLGTGRQAEELDIHSPLLVVDLHIARFY